MMLAAMLATGVVFSVHAAGDPIQQINQLADQIKEEIISKMNQSGGAIARKLAAVEQLLQILSGKNIWDETLWNQAVRVSEQAGIAVDELIPSVSGCIHDESGDPIYGAFIAVLSGWGIDYAAPTYAMTGSGTDEASSGFASTFGFAAAPPVLPVMEAFVPKDYLETFNQGGCYWVPLSPGILQSLYSVFMLADRKGGAPETLTTARVAIIPVVPGYAMSPVAKEVRIDNNGQFTVSDYDRLSDVYMESSKTVSGTGKSR